MHNVSGCELEFTGRSTWLVAVHHKGKRVDTIPLCWEDQIQRDSRNKPDILIAQHRKQDSACTFLSSNRRVVVIAEAKSVNTPRRIKKLKTLALVEPLEPFASPRIPGRIATKCRFIRYVHSNIYETD
jgi:hypothetical protein